MKKSNHARQGLSYTEVQLFMPFRHRRGFAARFEARRSRFKRRMQHLPGDQGHKSSVASQGKRKRKKSQHFFRQEESALTPWRSASDRGRASSPASDSGEAKRKAWRGRQHLPPPSKNSRGLRSPSPRGRYEPEGPVSPLKKGFREPGSSGAIRLHGASLGSTLSKNQAPKSRESPTDRLPAGPRPSPPL